MVIQKRFILALTFVFISLPGGIVQAGYFYKEAIFIGGYSNRDQWVGKKGKSLKNSIGFEYYRKFSNDYGDFLTLDFQMRVAYDPKEDSQDAFGVEIHNAWLEYKLGLGESLRLGHFDPAFGLEPVLDTHGALLQTLAPYNIGFKKDWGLRYKGLLGDFDYEIAAQLGSGMSIRSEDGSFLLTGRISRSSKEDFQYGISFLYGRTLLSEQTWTIPAAKLLSHDSVRKTRIGLDLQCPLGPFWLKGEVAVGDNDGKTVGGALAQLEYTVPEHQKWRIKMQAMHWTNDWGREGARDLTLAPVIEYKLNSSVTLRLGYFHDIYASDGDEDRMVLLQLYCFGR